MAQTPIAINLVCCDQIIIEEHTRNITLVNCFVNRVARSFPANDISFTVFAILTDGQGEMPVEVVIQELDSMAEILRRRRMIQLTDQLQQLGTRFTINDCVFPAPGYYDVTLFANGDLIGNRRIQLKEAR